MSKVFEIAIKGQKEKEKLVARDDVQAAAIANVIKRKREADEKKAQQAKE